MDLNLIKPSVTKNCFCDNSGKLNMEWKLNHINKDFTVFLGSDKSIRIILKKKKSILSYTPNVTVLKHEIICWNLL